jgi:peptide/nickel transport system permease protein
MVFVGAVIYIASFTLIDILYTWADPRVRLE